MAKIYLALFFFANITIAFSQGKAVEVCNSNASKYSKSKSMIYSTSEKIYYKYNELKNLSDYIVPSKNGKVKSYIKSYYYLDEEKFRKALNIFIDDTYEINSDYVNEDSLDAELWHSELYNISVFYIPKETYNIDILIMCPNN